jgi:DNA modification methylase
MALTIAYKKIKELIPYCNNSRTHSDEQVLQIASSIKEFGFTNPVLIDGQGGIIAGHGRIMAAQKLKMDEVPTITLSDLSEAQKKAYIIADNKLALNSGWDDELLKIELEQLKELDFDLGLIGFSDDELALLMLGEDDPASSDDKPSDGSLADRFLIPPFSVLNAREGWWQERKRGWLALGIKSEVGRGDTLVGYSEACKKGYAKSYSGQDKLNEMMGGKAGALDTGTSIFDPVVCELVYSWFCPMGGVILDPFAGGSVRGIVASKLGRQYIGHELRAEQVAANQQQAAEICGDPMPAWICGDSRNIDKTCSDVKADLVFSCPPYADLEVYSDDPNDLSTLDYADFKKAYFEIIKKTCNQLKPDSFACFVIGEVRDKKGNYYNFVGDTIQAFLDAGLQYYNEAILVTAVGSLPIRVGKQFSSGRKLGKTHQNVLVFVKGDGKKATQACGDVFIHIPDELLNDNQAKNTN